MLRDAAVPEMVLFRVMRNGPISGTELVVAVEQRLRDRLPASWPLEVRRGLRRGRRGSAEAVAEITAPTGEKASVAIEVKYRIDARDVPGVLVQARRFPTDAVMLVAPFLSERARDAIAGLGVNYADATGNLRLQLERPAIFIEISGAASNPWPDSDEPLRTLKGPGAGRVVRALCELKPPHGVRELAQLSGAAASTTSRVVALADREGLVSRDDQARIVTVDWRGLVRRWAQDYSLTRSNQTRTYIEPRGLPALLRKLGASDMTYCVTGSLAAAARGSLTAPRLGVLFVEDALLAAQQLQLREADSGANAMLAEPLSDAVFDRTWQEDRVRYAGMAQVAVDILTGPGSRPAEAEEVLSWMGANEDEWRS